MEILYLIKQQSGVNELEKGLLYTPRRRSELCPAFSGSLRKKKLRHFGFLVDRSKEREEEKKRSKQKKRIHFFL